jgi:hypothetical protein
MRSLRGKAILMAGGIAAAAVGTVMPTPGGGDTSTDAFSDASSEASTS